MFSKKSRDEIGTHKAESHCQRARLRQAKGEKIAERRRLAHTMRMSPFMTHQTLGTALSRRYCITAKKLQF